MQQSLLSAFPKVVLVFPSKTFLLYCLLEKNYASMDRVDNVNFLHSYNLVVSSNKFHEAFKQVMLLATHYFYKSTKSLTFFL